MIRLEQTLDTSDDSFSYYEEGADEPRYHVDYRGALTERGVRIGSFNLRNEQWVLHVGKTVFMHGPRLGLFKLPEFELKALTALVNQERPSAL